MKARFRRPPVAVGDRSWGDKIKGKKSKKHPCYMADFDWCVLLIYKFSTRILWQCGLLRGFFSQQTAGGTREG